jgi:putative ABC transport system permease protein
MNTLLQDLKFSLRLLVKSPGFTAVAILTLAMAIGVNSAIFSIVNGLILRPVVPYKPAEVVSVYTTRKEAARDYRQFAYNEFAALRDSHEVFADVAAVNFGLAGIGRNDGMRRSFMFMVTDNFFSLMGANPAAGRFFTAEEARPNANLPVVVASYTLWQRNGGRPDFVGSTLFVNGQPHTVIGVAPKGFSGISALVAPEIWLPLGLFSNIAAAFGDAREINDLTSPKNYTLNVMARLQPGLTIESAKTRLSVLAERITAVQPADYAGGARELQVSKPSRFSISTEPENDGPISLLGILLVSMAGVVLLIACLNLANMLLARGTGRAREMAVRLAIGATRGQIVRQLLVEGLVLALAGGALGVLLSYWTNTLMENSFTTLLSSMNFSLAVQLQPDVVVLAVTFGFCLLATLAFSLGPAIKAARTDVVSDLKAQAGDAGVHGKWNRFFAARHLLVMAQMTLSLVLLFSAGLFFRGAIKAGGLAPGFDPAGVIFTELDYSLANTKQPEAMRRMLAAVDRARSMPGVEAAGLSTLVPYGNTTNTARMIPADAAVAVKTDPSAPPPGINGVYAAVTPGYLASIGVKVLRGRDFTEAEGREKGTRRVGIIDEGMAKKLFPDKDALGQHVRYSQPPSDGLPNDMEIVGVVSRHRHDLQDKDGAAKRIYVPLAQNYSASLFLSTRLTSHGPEAVLSAIGTLRKEFRALDNDMPILQMLPFSRMMEKSITLWIVRLGAVMFGVFGGIALLLAVVGVYGVKAYAVERRTREIGIRMALGANRSDVFALIMKQGAQQTAFSVVLGLILCLLVGQALSAILFQVSPTDPLALGVSVVVLSAATLLACYLPAKRATRVSPMTALRSE